METMHHTCPVCGAGHDIPAILHRLAYGRQLTCSLSCKGAFRQLVRSRSLAEIAERRRAISRHEAND